MLNPEVIIHYIFNILEYIFNSYVKLPEGIIHYNILLTRGMFLQASARAARPGQD